MWMDMCWHGVGLVGVTMCKGVGRGREGKGWDGVFIDWGEYEIMKLCVS